TKTGAFPLISDYSRSAAHTHAVPTPTPPIPVTLRGPVARAAVIDWARVVAVAIMRAGQRAADDRAGGEAADHAGGDSPATRFGLLRRSDRADRERSGECQSGKSFHHHTPPASHVGPPIQRFCWERGSAPPRERPVNGAFGMPIHGQFRGLNFC